MINFSLIYSCDFKENPLVWLCFYPIDFIVSPCSLPPYQNDGLSQISDLVLFSSVFMCIHHNFVAMWYGPSIFKFTCSYFFQVQVRHGWFIQSPNKIEYVYRHPKFNMFINEPPFPTISPSPWVSPYLSWWQHHPSIRSSQKKKKIRDNHDFCCFISHTVTHIQFIWKPTSFTSKHIQAFITFPTSTASLNPHHHHLLPVLLKTLPTDLLIFTFATSGLFSV